MNEEHFAALCVRLEDEYLAARRALHEPATVARHEFIARRYRSIGTCRAQLIAEVGEQQARIYERVVLAEVREQEQHPSFFHPSISNHE